jgi:hypothetical protein
MFVVYRYIRRPEWGGEEGEGDDSDSDSEERERDSRVRNRNKYLKTGDKHEYSRGCGILRYSRL